MGTVTCAQRTSRLDGSNICDLAFLYRDKACAFLAALTDVPSLQIAAENNVRVLVKDRTLVHMRQSPISVSLVDEVIEAARSIIGVPRCGGRQC